MIALGVPTNADFRLCGPSRFVSELTAALVAGGAAQERIHNESFGGAPPEAKALTPPSAGDGPGVAFSRSGVTTAWNPSFASLLDLAEANAVPVSSGCRIGGCHACRASLVAGSVRHAPEPLEPPPPGTALLCCAVPDGDVVLEA
jgi:ferredoxin